MADDFSEAALDYHRNPVPGKIQVTSTKPLATARDLGLAYTPGVAVACNAIVDNPEEAYNLTARGNLVGVVTNGTAVLGLGAIGPLASKPVMEGKARAVQEVRRHRCVRSRDRRARRGQAGRYHRQPGTDLRRHQSGGHQGPGMFRGRAPAARAHEDPGVS
ncbi:hypothetical protein [Oceanibaculum nanhaiense]|uniref:hypothetical protein n=1 Tax=Oceanibaculum nanhaiense TaxID=1909734 RepID=UPI003D2900C9